MRSFLIYCSLFQSATSKSASAPKFLRITINFMTNLKKLKPFVAVSVGELMWGYDDPLMQLAKEMSPDTKLPFEKFGLFFDVSILPHIYLIPIRVQITCIVCAVLE